MSKATISNTGDTANAPVTAYLFPIGVPAFDGNGNPVVPTVTTVSSSTGAWTMYLEETDTMSPSGMAWQITLGSGSVVYAQFGSGGGSLSGLEVTQPSPLSDLKPAVTVLQAGSGVTLSPATGEGAVTVSVTNPVTNTAALAGLNAAYGGLLFAKVHVSGKTGHAAGGGGAWVVPTGGAIVFPTLCAFNVTTVATAICLLDIGYTATNATTLNDTLLDGIDAHTATGLFGMLVNSTNTVSDTGNENPAVLLAAAGKWITISAQDSSSDLTGLVGDLYVAYALL
jgi:hypothetical protein